MDDFFEVKKGSPLSGDIRIPGAKNAALPMLCAALLTPEKCVFHDVPCILDIEHLLEIFRAMGVDVSWDKDKRIVEIEAKNIDPSVVTNLTLIKKMRASLLVMGPLLARFGKVNIPLPGGCIIGSRSNDAHIDAFKNFGAELLDTEDSISMEFSRKKLKNSFLLCAEASVTATENIAMFLASFDEVSEVFFAAAEPHVQALLAMLQMMGSDISGIGTHHLRIKGSKQLKGGTFTIPPDGIAIGSYAVGAVITGGHLRISNVNHKELYSFYGILKKVGVEFEMQDDALEVFPTPKIQAIDKVQTAIYPGFSTDLQSLIGLLMTQCEGESRIFETLFENRLTYLLELEKMGADISIVNNREAIIRGKSLLKGTEVQSWDLRAGITMILAGLIAEGTTRVTNIQYIDRGYENFEHNITQLGGNIQRVSV